jgi:hypothetical protein
LIRKRQSIALEPGAAGEVRFVNRLFRLAAGSAGIGGANCGARRPKQESPSKQRNGPGASARNLNSQISAAY